MVRITTTILQHYGDTTIEGWGMQDQLVAQRLNQLAFGPTNRASLIASYIPRIINDKTICRNRLMDLLRDPSCERPDFVIEGLKTLEHVQYTDGIIDCVLNIINSADKIKDDIRDYTNFQLFSCFPSNPHSAVSVHPVIISAFLSQQ